jgi:glucose-1-phosphate thymidylyltransferase
VTRLQAIVLAAGAGSRLWPYTETRPKPMVPVAGRPILEWLLDSLAEVGVTDVCLVVGYKANRIQSHVEDGADYGLDVRYVRQQVLMGSAAALARALEETTVPESTLVVGGDNVIEAPLLEALVDAGPNAIATTTSDKPSKYGVVHATDGLVDRVEEKPPIESEALISTGAALLDRQVLDQVPSLVERGLHGLADVFDHLAREGGKLRAVQGPGRWLDAVYPWDLLSLTDELVEGRGDPGPAEATVRGPVTIAEGATVEPGAVVAGPASIGRNARIGAGAVVNESVVMEDALVGPGASVDRSVVGDGSVVRSGAILARGEGVARTDDSVHAVDDVGAMIGEGCTVEGAGRVLPGTLVGNDSRVRAGATARERVNTSGEVR